MKTSCSSLSNSHYSRDRASCCYSTCSLYSNSKTRRCSSSNRSPSNVRKANTSTGEKDCWLAMRTWLQAHLCLPACTEEETQSARTRAQADVTPHQPLHLLSGEQMMTTWYAMSVKPTCQNDECPTNFCSDLKEYMHIRIRFRTFVLYQAGVN